MNEALAARTAPAPMPAGGGDVRLTVLGPSSVEMVIVGVVADRAAEPIAYASESAVRRWMLAQTMAAAYLVRVPPESVERVTTLLRRSVERLEPGVQLEIRRTDRAEEFADAVAVLQVASPRFQRWPSLPAQSAS